MPKRTTTLPPTRSWTNQAQNLIQARLRGDVHVADLATLGKRKREVLGAIPDTATPFDQGLASVLADQAAALDLLVDALTERPFDREQLAELATREAWRLKRHDLIIGLFDAAPLNGGSPD